MFTKIVKFVLLIHDILIHSTTKRVSTECTVHLFTNLHLLVISRVWQECRMLISILSCYFSYFIVVMLFIMWILCRTAGAGVLCSFNLVVIIIVLYWYSWLREAINYAHTFGPLNIFWYFGHSAFYKLFFCFLFFCFFLFLFIR